MAHLAKHGSFLLVVSLVAAGFGGGCGGSTNGGSVFTADAGGDATEDGSGDDSWNVGDVTPVFGDGNTTGGGDTGNNHHGFDVEPSALQTITVPLGQTLAAMPYTATYDGGPVSVGWTIDNGELGSIAPGPASTGTFIANGSAGGLVTVIAGYQGVTVKRQIFVQIDGGTQNGPNLDGKGESAQVVVDAGVLTQGGGVGGVGGEGLGQPVTDVPTQMALQSPADNGSSENLTILYPYDATVFPRGLLAPLIQWSWAPGDADAIQIDLKTTSGSFKWTGTFGPPAVLWATAAGGGDGGAGDAGDAGVGGDGGSARMPFIRNPIPQDVWAAATNTAGGLTQSGAPDQLTMSLTVAQGGVAHGPVSETWTIAPARLEGTVYYNSYGTRLVLNSNFTDKVGNQDGAAVLAITEGALGPTVVAGTSSPCTSKNCGGSGCRVCHTVAAGGNLLIVQHGDDYYATSWYDLKNGYAETVVKSQSLFGWAGLSNDGSLALTDYADLAAHQPVTQLYAFPASATANATPLSSNLPYGVPAEAGADAAADNMQAGTPAFSPDGKHVAFDFMGGTFEGTTGNGTQLVALDFDSTANQFSNLKVLATMANGNRAGFPSFFPTNDAVAFHYQTVNSNHRYNTWHGAQAQIWWSDLATGTAQNLYALNGLKPDGTTSYLPKSPYRCPQNANCGASPPKDDTTLNYEPTVNPISSGGYIWVVFTSRREYGNVANTRPWLSDPRDYDNTQLANATTKKLWVAAIDLDASSKPGTDHSHPAFYLPAQELLAGNSRGFWVLNPCQADGMGCMAGDECCNGYCEPAGEGGALVCANAPPNNTCSALQDKCATAADCCDTSNKCINGFCAQATAN